MLLQYKEEYKDGFLVANIESRGGCQITMFSWDDLKETLPITDDTVECPVKGCSHVVERQRKVFLRDERFTCPTHGIVISPSTWVYVDYWRNLINTETSDMALICDIKSVKRDNNRLGNNNSEDAVTWNFFRRLQRHNLVGSTLERCIGETMQGKNCVMYWSYSHKEQGTWEWLKKARSTFGEKPNRSTEPDLIIETDNVLVFIEAKVGATNQTKPSNKSVEKLYATGGDGWFGKVFHEAENFWTIAVDSKLYELMRMWLLGTWIAEQIGKKFVLINLVLEHKEEDIETRFGDKIIQGQARRFQRCAWEQLYHTVQSQEFDIELEQFFKGKTLGYNRNGELQRAFDLSQD